MKNLTLKLVVLLAPLMLWAQQDAQYTQYMYNMSVINPGYTTDNFGVLTLGGLHRSQWSGVVGAPYSSNLFAHIPLNNNIEVGASIINDNIGDVVKENNLFFDVAYKLNLEELGTISFGIKTGFTLFDVNFNGFSLESGDVFTDPDFETNINKTFFNFGTGVYYNTENYYVGFSIPNILNSKHLDRNNGKYQGTENAHVYVTGGYVFDLNDQFKIKPAFMMKSVKGSPIALDITANVLYNNKVEFGLGYRIEDALSGMVNFSVTPEFRIGYAYDHTISNLGPFSTGSHEIILLYNLFISNLNKGFEKSPRFF
jgi:type IX secretion system PorP/SprF family membrane protein